MARAVCLAIASLLAVLASCNPGERARARLPRIVLVTLDTLHVDRTSVYNPEVAFTPFLERFASEGVRFAYGYAHTATTLPSHASLMTGISPASLGVMINGDPVPEGAEMLAETLSEAGYRTAAFISLGVLRPSFGIAQGFDHFDDPFAGEPGRWYRRADEVFANVSGWLRDNAEDPFFLWLHLSDPHEPYVPRNPEPDAELWLDEHLVGRYNLATRDRFTAALDLAPGRHRLRWVSLRKPRPDDRPDTTHELLVRNPERLRGFMSEDLVETYLPLAPDVTLELANHEAKTVSTEVVFTGRLREPPPSEVLPNYDANVAFTDRYLGELDELLESVGIRDDTLVVIVSDHGEGLFTNDFLGHAAQAYEHQLRVLWMMRGPGIPKGVLVDGRPALVMDVAPTLLDLLGLDGSDVEGRSLVGCWDGSGCPESEPWWSFGVDPHDRSLTAMASYRWPYKWLWRRNEKRIAFDVAADPWEEHDLLMDRDAVHPEPLRTSAESFRSARRDLVDVLERGARRKIAPEEERILRSLGYLGGENR